MRLSGKLYSGFRAAFAVLAVIGLQSVVVAAETDSNDSLAKYLPADAIATAEISKLDRVIERIETSGLLQQVLASPQWRDAQKQDGVTKALAGKAIAEAQLGMSLWQFSKTYFGDRGIVGVYPPQTPGSPPDGVAIIRVRSAESLKQLWDRVSPLLTLVGDKLKVSPREGGGHMIQFEDGHRLVIRDQWIVVSKVAALLDQTLERLAKSPAELALAKDSPWKLMADQMGTDHEIQVCLNAKKLTELIGHRLIPAKSDNVVVSLLLGGYLELVSSSPYVGSTLDIRENGFEIRTAAMGDAHQLNAPYQAFVLESATSPKAGTPALPNSLNGFSLSRDFAGWYRNREGLLADSILPYFDKFETGIATFLPGRDFGQDVLPLFGRRLTVVSAPQNYSHLKGKPGVQIPGFAIIIDLNKPAEANDVLNMVFQTIVVISNLEASKQGRQPFVLSSEAYHDTQIAFAKYVKQPEGDSLPIAYNFQPASARVDDRYIFASSLEMCRNLVDSLKASKKDVERPTGTEFRDVYFEISPVVAADLLEANSSVIHAQSLQQGKSSEQSTQELSLLLNLLRQLKPVKLVSTRFDDRWQIELSGGWN